MKYKTKVKMFVSLICLVFIFIVVSVCGVPMRIGFFLEGPPKDYSEGVWRVLRLLDTKGCEDLAVELLRICRGPEAQVLRLLVWAGENKPKLRKELLRQWLAESESLPKQEQFMGALGNLTKCYTEVEVLRREREVSGVFASIKQEIAARKTEARISSNGTLCAQLDKLIGGDGLLGSEVFDASKEVRRAIYDSLPGPCLENEGEWTRPQSDVGQVYICLWVIEPDEELRMTLRTRIVKSYVQPRPGFRFWHRKLGPLLENMTDEQKKSRKVFIDSMVSPRLYGSGGWWDW